MNKGRDIVSDNLLHFTNREKEQDILRRILALPEGATIPVVMFYGVGGTGKTWLTQKLQELLEKREITTKAEPAIPCARIDLDIEKGGGVYHDDPARPYGEIRRQLNVPCPCFDLALAMLLHTQGVQDAPGLRHGEAGGTAWEFVKEGAAAALNSVPGGNLITWVADKMAKRAGHALRGTPFGDYVLSQMGNDDYLALQRMTPDALYGELPRRLGEDLDAHLPPRPGRACRGVVLLDSFEALSMGISNDQRQYARERWVVSLYEQVSSVLICIAGRDQLLWPQADRDWRDSAVLEQHLVGGLSRHDAERYLGKCGVVEGKLQNAVLRVCVDNETPNLKAGEIVYHPLSLGLCSDTIATERSRGVQTDPDSFDMDPGDYEKLAKRFLKSLRDNAEIIWMKSLALTPRFDEEAARHAFGNPTGPEWNARWMELRRFSFVTETVRTGWFALHPRMREALRILVAADSEAERADHARWRDHFASRSDDTGDDYAALAWYHRYRLEPRAATEEWNALAVAARTGGSPRMARHFALLAWWLPTGIETSSPTDVETAAALVNLGVEFYSASLGNRQENLSRAIAFYEAALRVYTEQDFPQDWAMTQNNLAIAYSELPTGDRGANVGKAIKCYEAALRVRTEQDFPQDWATTQFNLALLRFDITEREEACEGMRRAAKTYRAVGALHDASDAERWLEQNCN